MNIKLILPVLLGTVLTSHDNQTNKNVKNDEVKSNKATEVNINSVLFKDVNLNSAYQQYILVKNALVESNASAAQKAASALQLSLTKIKNAEKMMKSASALSETKDLESQRNLFSELSNELIQLAKNSEFSNGEIYVEFCPMANKSKGAYWLANEKEINNPYYGNQMLHCGSVKETIK
ncbi:DUF3347 domain-containing protein [Solitalea koreensis]|uniref:DUF3347 domain-containing protein n=1 Tax=Solitalea koreensis TaxID=543615 RepID=A0A521BAA3_9SPHI|nr:DUF3347 domain-containing protein [Solitalea koreensis]SMO44008.1 Protein of unknown function [Solitalea koreensis]